MVRSKILVNGKMTMVTQKTIERLEQEKEKFRVLFEMSKDAIMTLDSDAKFTSCNEATLKMFGVKSEKDFCKLSPASTSPKRQGDGVLTHIKAKNMIDIAIRDGCSFFDWTHIDSNGKTFPVTVWLVKVKFNDEVYLMATVRNMIHNFEMIESLRENENKLYESEKQNNAILNTTADLAMLIDKNGKIMALNKAMANAFGQSPDEMINKIIYDILPPDLGKLRKKKGEEAAKLGTVVRFVDQRSGRWMENNIYPIFGEKGEILQYVIFSHDITERKQMEDALKSSEERLKIIFDSAPDAIYLNDLKGIFIDGNSAAEQMLGYKREELIGKSFLKLSLLTKKDLPKAINYLIQSARGKKTGPEEYTLIRKDKSQIEVEISTFPVKIKNKKMGLGIARDISKRKKTEQLLKESEYKFRSVLENIQLIGLMLDKNANITFVNDYLLKLTGWKRNEVIRRNWFDCFIDKDIRTELKNIFKKALEGNNIKTSYENEIITKNGKKRWIKWSNTPHYDRNGKPDSITSIGEDITEQKNAKKSLIASNEKYRKFFMDDLTGDYLSTREGEIVDCNPQFMKIFGFESLKQAQQCDAVKLYKSKSDRENFIKLLEKNKSLLDIQTETFRVNGEKIIVKENVMGEFDDDGRLINIRGYLFDVTDRVKAEQEVLKLSEVVEQSPLHIMITDSDGKIEYVNQAFTRITGYSVEEMRGKNPSILKSGETAVEVYQQLWNTILSGQTWRGEIKNKKKDGEVFWQSAVISPSKDKMGNITNFVAVLRDITQDKEMLEKLMEREEKYRTLTQNLNVGVYRNTPGPEGKFIEVNPALLKMLGFQNKKGIEYYKVSDFYPDPRKRIEIDKKLIENGFLINEEIELRRKDGTRFIASVSATAHTNGGDEITHFDGIVEDITERKKFSDELSKNQKRLEMLSNEIVIANEAVKRQLAVSLHDTVGQSLAVAKFKTSELLKSIDKLNDKEKLNDIIEFINNAIDESRNITYELSPTILYELGLIEAIGWKLEEIEKKNKLKVKIVHQSDWYSIDQKDSLIIYRSFNEILQNVIKHSKTSKVEVTTMQDNAWFKVVVKDYGVGFDFMQTKQLALKNKNFGLLSIIEQMRYIGGDVHFDSKAGKGTTVTIKLPVKN